MGIRVLDLRTGKQKLILPDAAQAVYLDAERLLYVRRDGTALVTGFDPGRLELTGQRTPVFDGVQTGFGFAHLAGSTGGTVVYIQGSSSADNVMVRVGSDGQAVPFDPDWYGAINSFALSPDGRQMSVGTGSADGDLNIWIKHLDRGPVTRLSFGGRDRRPAWSPDGRTVAFIRDSGNISVVMARAADGSSSADRLLARIDNLPQEIEWSSDGKWLVLRTDTGTPGAGDLIGIRVGGDTTPVRLVDEPFHRAHALGVARLTLAGLRLERVGDQRGLCAAIPQHRCGALAGVGERRLGAAVVARRTDALLPRCQQADDRRAPRPRRRIRGDERGAAVRRERVPARRLSPVVRGDGGWAVRVPAPRQEPGAVAGARVVWVENWR